MTPEEAAAKVRQLSEQMPTFFETLPGRAAEELVRPAVLDQIKEHGHQDRGGLMKSWRRVVEAGRSTAQVLSNAVQAAILNYGGDIRPKKAGALTVPITTKGELGEGPGKYHRAREFPGLRITKMDVGDFKNLTVLAQWGARKGARKPIFALLRKVHITGSGYLTDALAQVNRELPKYLLHLIDQLVPKGDA